MSESAIVVTGGAQGLGRAHALAVADLCDHVYVADVRDTAQTEKELESAGQHATGFHLDVTDEAEWAELLEKITADGRVATGLVNNAGVSFRHRIEDTPVADFRRVLDINLTGTYLGIRTFGPVMAAAGRGAIVNIGSIAAATGYFSPSYGASKWGIVGLTKTAAGEWADRGLRVNAVLPGVVETPILAGAGALIAAYEDAIVMGRAARPDEMARVVRFLLSDEASYVNGADWAVDGGMVSNGLFKQILDKAGGHLDKSAPG